MRSRKGSIQYRFFFSNIYVLEMAPEFQTEFSKWEMDLNLNSRPHWPELLIETTVTLSESNCNYYKNDPKSRPRCPITKRKISTREFLLPLFYYLILFTLRKRYNASCRMTHTVSYGIILYPYKSYGLTQTVWLNLFKII